MQVPASTPRAPRAAAWMTVLAIGALMGCGAAPSPQAEAAEAATTLSPPRPAVVPTAASGPAAAAASAATVQPEPGAPVVDDAAHEAAFARWIADFRRQAQAEGIPPATLQTAFEGVRFLPRVVELDRAQPEFTRAVWDYLDRAVSPQRVRLGQDKLLPLRAEPLTEQAAARHGVPLATVVAIWGMESNYGSHYGDIPTIDALATLGFEGRRADWARGQLLAALKIIQSGDIDRAHMIGSWAGAMGQTQFLPSNFLAYAVDADGDGRRDIWGSMADVVASTANFLARAGWQSGQAWGVEVRLPEGFDHARADPDLRQGATRWAAEGVRTLDGTALPDVGEASLLLPAGARGPAFLVGPNFRTVLRYNNSTSYALAVHLLAQQIVGGPGVQAAWPRDLVTLTRSQVLALQQALNARGFDTGEPDGVAGPATRKGLRAFQRSLGLPADGYPTTALLDRLQAP